MNAIEAVNVPVPQPEVPPCELWVNAWVADGKWFADWWRTEPQCDEEIESDEGIPVRKFRLSDQPPPPVDQAAVAEAWNAWLESQPMVDIEDFDDQTFSRNIARFVSKLVAKGVPRAI